MEAADGLFGAEGAIEPDSCDHGGGDGGFYDLAGGEFFNDFFVNVAKFDGVKGGTFWGGSGGCFFAVVTGRVFRLRGVVFKQPCLVIGVEFLDGEGEDTATFSEGDLFSIV